jgi:cell division protein FtsN
MVKKKKAKKALVSIEFGLGGLMGLAVASFCIFLWMFLFGMWTGQSVLQTTDGPPKMKDGSGFAAKIRQKDPGQEELNKKSAVKSSLENSDNEAARVEKVLPADQEASFFAVQVSAFKDEQRAAKSVLQWRSRDYESFYLRPDLPNGTFHRVFVGRFESLAEANTLAAKLESAEQRKVFIMLVSVDQEQLP